MDNVTSMRETRKPKPVHFKLHYQCISSTVDSNRALSKFLNTWSSFQYNGLQCGAVVKF